MEVQLICIKVKSKLRVRITSPGYLNDANCQFPKDLRVEGRRFSVPSHCITLVESRGKHFQSVPRGVAIILDNVPTKIQEDESLTECAICLSEPKQSVFMPCGHQYCCSACASRLTTCPICRQRISNTIAKGLLL